MGSRQFHGHRCRLARPPGAAKYRAAVRPETHRAPGMDGKAPGRSSDHQTRPLLNGDNYHEASMAGRISRRRSRGGFRRRLCSRWSTCWTGPANGTPAASPARRWARISGTSVLDRRHATRLRRMARESLGLERGSRVALMLPNVPGAIWPACWGALRAGPCTVVNVNPLLQAGGTAAPACLDSGAQVIVILENFAHTLQDVAGPGRPRATSSSPAVEICWAVSRKRWSTLAARHVEEGRAVLAHRRRRCPWRGPWPSAAGMGSRPRAIVRWTTWPSCSTHGRHHRHAQGQPC